MNPLLFNYFFLILRDVIKRDNLLLKNGSVSVFIPGSHYYNYSAVTNFVFEEQKQTKYYSYTYEQNGRLYDPVICRFFSPDNFVQLPEFTQSFNRYSYCLNNPLKYTDPSGWMWVDDLIEVDNTGGITITTQGGNDIVRTHNGRSVELSGNGVFRAALTESSENAIKLTGLSRDDANRIFNLLGDYTGVEWGKLEATNVNGGMDYFVGSSRQVGSEGIISGMIYDDLPAGSVQRYDHSHPFLHRSDVEGYRYSINDAGFWNDLNRLHPNSSAGIRFNGRYDLYYRNGVQTNKYNNPLYQYRY